MEEKKFKMENIYNKGHLKFIAIVTIIIIIIIIAPSFYRVKM